MNLEKATGMLGKVGKYLGISTQQVRHQAHQVIEEELEGRG